MEHMSYNDIMKDSQMRRNATEVVISSIQVASRRNFSAAAIKRLSDVLSEQEVEEGVSVFMVASKPSKKTMIGKVDLDKEYVTLWWGKNIHFKEGFYGNKYALGITFSEKGLGNAALFTLGEMCARYPEFKETLEKFPVGSTFDIFCYAKAGEFYKEVKDMPGEWLLQTPSETGGFIPARPIGKLLANDKLHIYQPKNDINARRYAKTIRIVE